MLVAVYGSLRQEGYNHQTIQEANGHLVGQFSSDPLFTMYNLGSYPAVTLNGANSVVFEVYDVLDVATVDNLEGYVGDPTRDYYGRTAIATPWGSAYLYYLNPSDVEGRPIVESGDWIADELARMNNRTMLAGT